jgi:formylglycine-generating enzyme required for sulfatase activity
MCKVNLGNGMELEMVFVEGCTFKMGIPEREETVSNFYIGKYSITQEQWEAVMGTRPWEREPMICIDFPELFQDANLSVTRVTHKDIDEFILKLNSISDNNGKKIRLPREAEWECAARGGKNGRIHKYSEANTIETLACNVSKNSRISEVQEEPPNELGIHGIGENIYEWFSDSREEDKTLSELNPDQRSPDGREYLFRKGNYYQRTSDQLIFIRQWVSPIFYHQIGRAHV